MCNFLSSLMIDSSCKLRIGVTNHSNANIFVCGIWKCWKCNMCWKFERSIYAFLRVRWPMRICVFCNIWRCNMKIAQLIYGFFFFSCNFAKFSLYRAPDMRLTAAFAMILQCVRDSVPVLNHILNIISNRISFSSRQTKIRSVLCEPTTALM